MSTFLFPREIKNFYNLMKFIMRPTLERGLALK